MATKTINLDPEAYERLDRLRKGDESFSDLVKRLVQPPWQAEAFERMLRETAKNPMPDDAIAAVEKVIGLRGAPKRQRGSKRGAA